MRKPLMALLGLSAVVLLVSAASAADGFEVRKVSENASTITLGWDAQPGDGYQFFADGTAVSRTFDPSRTTVKFSKGSAEYRVVVLHVTSGSSGIYPPPPPAAACANGLDDDNDGKIDLADPGCSSTTDNDETDPAPPPSACADGIDNDGDSKVDMADPGCSSPSDDDETDPVQPPPTGFPDAGNTGVPAGTTLTAYTGPNTITTPNTVIAGKTIGCITIQTTGVIIRNSRISGNCGYAVVATDDRTSTQLMVTIEDSEIICTGSGGVAAVGESDFVVRRTEVTGCENGFDINQNALVEDSYIHNLANGSESHADGIQFGGGHWNGSAFVCCGLNITIRHNTIYGMGDNDTTFGTSAIISNPGGDTNILIENNLLAGGSATLYCEINAKGNNYRVINNAFSTKFKSTVGYYFPSTDCSDETQSGNYIYETGKAIALD